jgi:hypothetical protein
MEVGDLVKGSGTTNQTQLLGYICKNKPSSTGLIFIKLFHSGEVICDYKAFWNLASSKDR